MKEMNLKVGPVLLSAVLALSLAYCSGCKGKSEKGKAEVAREEVKAGTDKEGTVAAEPFMVPTVENVAGGEDFKGERAAARELIVRYNKAVAAAQIHMDNLADLKGLTTKKEFTRMYASVEMDRSQGKIMSCTLKNLTFKGVSLKGEKGVVKTSEDWFFEDRDLKTGKVMVPLRDHEYEVEYSVVKMEEKWLVDKIDLKLVKEYMPPRGKPTRGKEFQISDEGGKVR